MGTTTFQVPATLEVRLLVAMPVQPELSRFLSGNRPKLCLVTTGNSATLIAPQWGYEDLLVDYAFWNNGTRTDDGAIYLSRSCQNTGDLQKIIAFIKEKTNTNVRARA